MPRHTAYLAETPRSNKWGVSVIALVAGAAVVLGVWAAIVPPRWPQSMPLLLLAALAQWLTLVFQPTWYGTLFTLGCVTWWGWRNRASRGLAFASGGMVLNLGVMLACGGAMPIGIDILRRLGRNPPLYSLLAGSKDIVVPMTHLWWLGDWLPIQVAHHLFVLSIGDVLLAIGLVWWMIHATIQHFTVRRTAPHPIATCE